MELQEIINRLASLGYTYNDETDAWLVNHMVDKVVNHICNSCNIFEIPQGLKQKAIDMVCGEFLQGKFSQGQLDVESAIKIIKEGDTEVEFSTGGTPEECYLKYINNLTKSDIDLVRYRKMSWS